MTTFLFIFMIFAMFHFVYESILLPMFRLELRYKLFEQRDKLRKIKIETPNSVEDNVFYLLEDTICIVINRLPFLSFSNKYDASKEYETNSAFRNRVKNSIEIIESCENIEVKKINKKIMKISMIGFLLNGGGWIYILLPVLLLVVILAFVTSKFYKIKTHLMYAIYKLTYASENDFGKFSHI